MTDLVNLPAAANTASDGTFWTAIMFMIWVILMLLFSFYGFEVAVTIGTFLALVIGVMLVYAGLVAFKYLLVLIGILIAMFLYIIWSSAKVRT